MPGDCLSLAVFIGSQPYGFGLVGEFLQLGDHLLLVGGNLVFGPEASGDVDTHPLLAEVSYMAYAGLYGEVAPKVFLDCLYLSGRLYYKQVFQFTHTRIRVHIHLRVQSYGTILA